MYLQRVLLGLLLFFWGAPVARGGLVLSPIATGADLVGGDVVVVFSSGATITAPIVLGSGFQEGMAFVPGMFLFSVAGDTSTAIWSLANLTPVGVPTPNLILTLFINTFFSSSAFDASAPNPGTFDSGPGLSGVIQAPGPFPFPVITASTELLLTVDPLNAGDIFDSERLDFANFLPGTSAFWFDDTDLVVPEPGTGALALFWLSCAIAVRQRTRAYPRT